MVGALTAFLPVTRGSVGSQVRLDVCDVLTGVRLDCFYVIAVMGLDDWTKSCP